MKADISLGNSGASNCWTRQMKDAIGESRNGATYKSDLHCRKLNIKHQVGKKQMVKNLVLVLKSLWHVTTGLLCGRDRFLICVLEYLKMALSKKVCRVQCVTLELQFL